ncbi:hypothetical protein E1B28_010948 [Marasmius oreades]|uniref:Uncharacterized protein n=1 Tax=Marasmius oreades TaxID=181124 RepID=A0A9P7RT43_9AGAR|nr:uncharacterized protein E1B28_010948 [Marasmius oreades]KAG7089249.1 hypothetical protein E1B28_010948 [Marasmius oreades]
MPQNFQIPELLQHMLREDEINEDMTERRNHQGPSILPQYFNQTPFNQQNCIPNNDNTSHNTGQQRTEMQSFMNAPNVENRYQTFLCLVNPTYIANNPTLSAQIKTITADVLRATGNTSFLELEQDRDRLAMEVRSLTRKNDQLQDTMISVLNSQPLSPMLSTHSMSDSTASVPSHANADITVKNTNRPIREDCNVDWWDCPPAKDPDAFSHVKVKNGKGVFAWMQDSDGQHITYEKMKKCYGDHHMFWNSQDTKNLPRNFTSIGYRQRDAVVEFLESRNDWLKLCDGNWKAVEVVKKNYYRCKVGIEGGKGDEEGDEDEEEERLERSKQDKRKSRNDGTSPSGFVTSDSGYISANDSRNDSNSPPLKKPKLNSLRLDWF